MEERNGIGPDSEEPTPAAAPRRRRWRLRIPGPPRRLRRLLFGGPLLFAGFMAFVGAGVAFGGTQALTWMETPAFCGKCHTMGPEVAAHAQSAHAGVECAQCHVGEGLTGLAKAKIGGMRQMAELVLGDYARPIPPAADKMPPASETCTRCHDPARERSDLLITRTHYGADEQNTPQQIGLVLRLAHDAGQTTQGIHWHVLSKVTFVPPAGGEAGATGVIPWVGVEKADGSHEEFIATGAGDVSAQVGDRAAALAARPDVKQMSCYDCHNRVGHDFPNPSQAIDLALSDKRIDAAIPYIKEKGLQLLTAPHDSADAFDGALRELEQSYARDYPFLYLERPAQMQQAFATLLDIYQNADYPAMNAKSQDYPNLLGHTASTGCFRCHDGAHVKVVDGQLTKQTIPSQCSTCHTFPSVGQASLAPVGQPPSTHTNPLWVFEHKSAPGAASGSSGTCGSCHAQSYCVNCHSSPVKDVKHDQMLYNHAAVIRKVGQDVCSTCHQKPFCARCHAAGTPN